MCRSFRYLCALPLCLIVGQHLTGYWAGRYHTARTIFGSHSARGRLIDYTTGFSDKGSIRRVDQYNLYPKELPNFAVGQVGIKSVPQRRYTIACLPRPSLWWGDSRRCPVGSRYGDCRRVEEGGRTMRQHARVLSAAVATCVLAAGCGSGSRSAPTSSSTATAAGPSQPAAAQRKEQAENEARVKNEEQQRSTAAVGVSYEDTVLVPRTATFDFGYRVAVSVNLGAATTNTEGQTPPNVNVVVPVTGTASLTNTTSGYTAKNLPVFSLLALYPAPTCDSVVEDHSGHKYCAIEIAVLAPGCTAGTAGPAQLESLGSGESGQLEIFPSPTVQGGADISTLINGDSVCDPNSPQGVLKPSPNLIIGGIADTDAPRLVAALGTSPRYWAVILDRGPCAPEGNTNGNSVLLSKPPGLKACVGYPATQ